MRTLDQWLEQYGQCHQNPTNKTIHWICVPLIYWSVYALASAIPAPAAWSSPLIPLWSLATLLAVQIYYFWLAPKLGLGMLVFNALVVGSSALLLHYEQSLWQWGLVVFVLAWIGQFIGHLIEKAKPSFFEDVQFLLIGPIWLLNHLLTARRTP